MHTPTQTGIGLELRTAAAQFLEDSAQVGVFGGTTPPTDRARVEADLRLAAQRLLGLIADSVDGPVVALRTSGEKWFLDLSNHTLAEFTISGALQWAKLLVAMRTGE